MKSLKNFFVIALLVASAQLIKAQPAIMKDPVCFKLRNGLTVILAENPSIQKVYATLTSDTEQMSKGKTGVQEVLNTMLNMNSNIKGLNFDDKGMHIAANQTDFNTILTAFSNQIQAPFLTQSVFEEAVNAVNTGIQNKERSVFCNKFNACSFTVINAKRHQNILQRSCSPGHCLFNHRRQHQCRRN